MAFSSGAQRDLYYAVESSFGAGDNLDSMKEVRNTEDSISLSRDNFVSDERRGDRGIHDMRLGNKQPAGDISFEFSYGAFDDFLVAALGSSWTTDIANAWIAPYTDLAVSDVTVVASTSTLTRATGSWLSDGVKVGDVVTVAMSSLSSDATGKVATLSATVMVLEDATNLEDVSVAEAATVNTTARIIKKGSQTASFVVEKAFTDIGEYQLYSGGVVNSMSIDLNPNAMITGSFGMLFKDADNDSSAFHTGTPDAVATNRPFDGFTGYITEGGSALAQASGLSISLDNGFNRNFVLMQTTCPQMTSGKSNCTGSVTLYFENSTVYDKFVNESESSIEFQLEDGDENSYIVTLPRIKYTTADTPVASDDAIVNTMNFQALDDVTEGTNIIIRKQPKVA